LVLIVESVLTCFFDILLQTTNGKLAHACIRANTLNTCPQLFELTIAMIMSVLAPLVTLVAGVLFVWSSAVYRYQL
jgi:hypothetical protein